MLLPALDQAPAHQALGLGQLAAIVDAGHLLFVDQDGRRPDAAGGALDDVGQVVLALRVLRHQLGHRLAQKIDGRGVDAGVDLVDLALGRRGVLVLDDAGHLPLAVADHPPVAGGVRHPRAQHGQPLGLHRLVDQRGQGLALQHGHVPVEDDDDPVPLRERLDAQLHGVTGAALLGLLDHGHGPRPVARHQLAFDRLDLVAQHGDDGRRLELPRALDGIGDEGGAQQPVQHLGAGGVHAGPLARGEDQASDIRSRTAAATHGGILADRAPARGRARARLQ